MEFITVNKDNIETEHICCAISNNRDCQVASKKAWLSERFDDGLVFRKANERGKCFIEYIPAEKAWAPIIADGYMYIDCLWVSGKLKGNGYSSELLQFCIDDSKAKGKKGIVALSSPKKLPFLSDPKFLAYKGFQLADSAEPYFTLLYLPFDESAEKPCFREQVKKPKLDGEKGFTLYYTNQCPYTAKYVPIEENIAKERNVPFRAVKIDTLEKAQNAPIAFTSYSLFRDGEFLTHEIQSEQKLIKLIEEYQK